MWNAPDEVIGHCAAVQKTALILTDRLMDSGIVLDRGLVVAATLYDVARVQNIMTGWEKSILNREDIIG